jgi:FixJ family two-component response regulator
VDAIPNQPVYIVDDDGSVRKAVRRLLTSAGYDVEEFASGEDFLEAVPTDRRAVVVLDVRMPGLDGLELQRRLVRAESPLRIIFVTAFPQPGEAERGLEDGAVGFLEKPFDAAELLELVRAASAAP